MFIGVLVTFRKHEALATFCFCFRGPQQFDNFYDHIEQHLDTKQPENPQLSLECWSLLEKNEALAACFLFCLGAAV